MADGVMTYLLLVLCLIIVLKPKNDSTSQIRIQPNHVENLANLVKNPGWLRDQDITRSKLNHQLICYSFQKTIIKMM
jgi:hypothetical protein